MKNFGLYIHIPFCRKKCIYCDFYSSKFPKVDKDAYVEAILNELQERKDELEGDVATLYIGGGTPSMLTSAQLSHLFEGMREIMGERFRPCEITLEVNPEDVDEQRAEEWLQLGITRISMGVQSLDDDELKMIGRRHGGDEARRKAELLRRKFSNISLDIIFGLPGQKIHKLIENLKGIISLSPDHISAYSLMYEERTALTQLRDMGKLEEVEDVESVEMFREICRYLSEAGYERYEISNFALPGKRSRHNSSYWRGEPYIGIGPSAHSYDGYRCRRGNKADINLYMRHYGDRNVESDDEIAEREFLTDDELREEMVLTRLRCIEGLDLGVYAARFGEEKSKELQKNAKRYIADGSLEIKDNSISLTDKGVMIADEIIVDLL